jgi:hypothetical protein
MKTISKIAILLVIPALILLSSGMASAANPAAKCIREVLKEAVKYPDCLMKKGSVGDVVVVFTLSDEGKIQVKSVKTSCPELAEYVKEKLSNTSCSEVISPYNQHYMVTFKFRMT